MFMKIDDLASHGEATPTPENQMLEAAEKAKEFLARQDTVVREIDGLIESTGVDEDPDSVFRPTYTDIDTDGEETDDFNGAHDGKFTVETLTSKPLAMEANGAMVNARFFVRQIVTPAAHDGVRGLASKLRGGDGYENGAILSTGIMWFNGRTSSSPEEMIGGEPETVVLPSAHEQFVLEKAMTHEVKVEKLGVRGAALGVKAVRGSKRLQKSRLGSKLVEKIPEVPTTHVEQEDPEMIAHVMPAERIAELVPALETVEESLQTIRQLTGAAKPEESSALSETLEAEPVPPVTE